VGLIILSTVIPPLPLPVPLIEIAAGLALGSTEGFIIVWFSQVISSLLAFLLARFFGKRLFAWVPDSKLWKAYRLFVNQKGPLAVFLVRAMMAAPFNIISFVAGVTEMKTLSFTLATIFGTIPESLLFTFLGTQLRDIHLSLWYLFIILVLLGVAGSLITLGTMRFLRLKEG
jgi:uncharacterized membrane protein YdjX (TVP38/TMEM64 family)